MPQNTNLNTAPYFDDFSEDKNFKRVLFKPGTPIQSRELTTLQSILQNQIESFGKHFFKEGAKVIPGQTSYDNQYEYVQVNNTFFGTDVRDYISLLIGKSIVGATSGVTATVINAITDSDSDRNTNTLYVRYVKSNSTDFTGSKFENGEELITESTISTDNILIESGSSFASCISENATGMASSAAISEGVYFIRGHFVKVISESVVLDQYGNAPSYRIGLLINEEIVTAFDDDSLYDNAQGYSNYSAPGADRFKISTTLVKKDLTDFNDENFIELMRIENGILQSFVRESVGDTIRDELARRTFDESGNYIVDAFELFAKESLNDYEGNGGIYTEQQTTSEGNTPSDSLALLQVSPGKAYVKGYEIGKISNTFIDIEKPRTSNTVESYSLTFNSTAKIAVNNVTGSAQVGFGTTTTLLLSDSRVGSNGLVFSGNEIGVARIYDHKSQDSRYSSDLTKYELFVYDIQTYTKVSISTTITLNTPAFIKGNSSGATGYLQSSISASPNLTLYCSNGSFIQGETISVNGISSAPTIVSVRDYDFSDVKSIYSQVGINTFTADLDLSLVKLIAPQGTQFTITSGGSVTVGLTSAASVGIKTGDIIRYTKTGNTVSTYNRVTAVSPSTNTFTVAGITSVTNICDGTLPAANISVNDLVIVNPEIINGGNSTLITPLPQKDISNLDLISSQVKVKKTYTLAISGSQATVTETDLNLFFAEFDVEDYILSYSNGNVEPLRSGQVTFTNGNKTITITQLSVATDSSAKLIASLNKINASSKQKVLNRCATVTISRSTAGGSGIGTSSLNDGLTYSTIYGTRVQDDEISLNVPDVLRVHAIFESNDTATPTLPQLSLVEISGSLLNAIQGDVIVGTETKASARVISTTASTVNFVYITEKTFKLEESVTFKKSGIFATISNVTDGDPEITENYSLDSGSRLEFLDYGRIVRKSTAQTPTRQITVVFDHYTVPSGDAGDFVSFSSYDSDLYSRDIPSIRDLRSTDSIDIRPRVANYNTSTDTLSPFEFKTRSFISSGTYSNYPIYPNSQIILGYSYYLPRIDKLLLTKEGFFELRKGVPSDNPIPPIDISTSLDVATIRLRPYVYSVKQDITIAPTQHKRYTMADITKLENRLANVEQYTALSLLESDTSNLTIRDSQTGLDRFKSGFFVDNFKNHIGHILSGKSSIDTLKGELRPSHYTTGIDLLIGSQSLVGVGSTANQNADARFVDDLQSPNLKRTGSLITLSYTETIAAQQRFATRTENVNPFAVATWIGNIELAPSSDTWIAENRLAIRNIEDEGSFNALINALGADPNTGLAPTDWGSWQEVWSGQTVVGNELVRSETNTQQLSDTGWTNTGARRGNWPFLEQTRTSAFLDTTTNTNLLTTRTDTRLSRNGINFQVSPRVDRRSLGSSVVSRDIIPFLRSRNIEFVAKRMRPRTQFYAFFDKVAMTDYCVPKLLEISMVSGTFAVGETVVGYLPGTTLRNSDNTLIRFRVAQSNHKYGAYNSPTQTFDLNPYEDTLTLAQNYSSTATVLNIDTFSLGATADSEFYGRVVADMVLVGQTSGAQATVRDIRLVSDRNGTLIGSLFIPDPASPTEPEFETGRKTLLLTANRNNNPIPGSFNSQAEVVFTSSGELNTTQETVISTRNADVQRTQVTDTTTVSQTVSTLTRSTTAETRTVTNQNWYDPIAETFLVTDDGGIFVTSLDVFFATKDDNIPVTCQIRTTQVGTPTSTIIAFSQVTLESSQVQTSNDGSVATRFTFSSPVYLEGNGREYAIVLLSDSNQYTVWISRMGEVEIGTANLSENQRVIVSQQPYLGSLFKSQNGSTWDPSQLEDLKFVLNKAQFTTDPGVFKLYNPKLGVANGQRPILRPNPIQTISKEVIVGLGSTVPTTFLTPGVTITQLNNTNTTGKLSRVTGAIAINNTQALQVNNVGSGLTPSASNFTFTGVNLTSISGVGTGAQMQITISSGNIGVITVTNGGRGYAVGDVLTARIGSVSENVRFNVGIVSAANQLTVTNVQGNFDTINQIAWTVGSGPNVGIASTLPAIPSTITNNPDKTGLYMKVSHRNHGMHGRNNKVTISNAISDLSPVSLSAEYLNTATTSLPVSAVGIFTSFENVGVSSTNPGYIKINNEVLSYTGTNASVSPQVLTGISRAIDSTVAQTHLVNSPVMKYELNGVSLRRVNTTHNFVDVDVANEIDLDSYYVKINTAASGLGTARDGSNGLPILAFNNTAQAGGRSVRATQNVQFETMTPNVQIMLPTTTQISTRVRTVSATSVDGTEISFQDQGYEPINLNEQNSFTTPRIICSEVNELQHLSSLPGNKSFTMEMTLSTQNRNVSPVIDLDRINVITTTNRINRAVTDFIGDNRVDSDLLDPSAAVYVTKRIDLETPATALDVRFAAFRDESNDIRVLYKLYRPDAPDGDQPYILFPGYGNLSDGTPDRNIASSNNGEYLDYKFTANNLPEFTGFTIKVVLNGTNQAIVPKLKEFRAIALA
jgi:hypothetical protein